MSISQQKESRFTNIAHIISAMVLAFHLSVQAVVAPRNLLQNQPMHLQGKMLHMIKWEKLIII